MRFITLFILIILSVPILGQSGFIKTFQYKDSIPVIMQNMLYDNDKNSLILSGITLNDIPGRQGLYIRELDTLGVFIMDTIIMDATDDFAISENLSFIKTRDGGYASIHNLFAADRIVFLEFEHNFNKELHVTFEEDENDIISVSPKGLYEFEDGYIIHLSKQHTNFRIKPHLIKIDKQGIVMWEKEYGQEGFSHSSFSSVNDQNILITGSRGNDDINIETGTGKYLYVVDFEGNLINEHYFENNEPKYSRTMDPTTKDTEGNFIIDTSPTYWSNSPYSTQLAITKYDENLDEIWTTQYGHPDGGDQYVDWGTITTDNNGNILASGNSVTEDLLVNPVTLIKLSPDGDILWTRLDSINYTEFNGVDFPTTNTTYKHIVLPSGSIVMCGTSKTDGEPFGNTRYGYVIKVDKNGCIEPECRNVNVDTKEIKEENELIVFPNPSTGVFQFSVIKETQISIFNSMGQLILSKSLSQNDSILDISNQPCGLYFAQLNMNNQTTTIRLVKEGN